MRRDRPKRLIDRVSDYSNLPGIVLLTFVDKRVVLLVCAESSKGCLELSQARLGQSSIAQEVVDDIDDGTKLGQSLCKFVRS